MNEKKTFSGRVDIDSRTDGWSVEDFNTSFTTEGLHWFANDEWDMEVTFTKKAKPIQIHSIVEDLEGNTGRVVSVQGDKAWVHYYLNDGGRAVDFDCVEWLTEISNVE